MVSFVSLFSGSDRNSSVIKYKNTTLMVDCGGSFKKIKEQLSKIDMTINDIDALLITHSHSDHIKALPMILKNREIPVYSSMGTHEELFDMDIKMPKSSRIIIYDDKPFSVGDIGVCSFKTPHDTNHSIGFNFAMGSKRVTYATDLGHVDSDLEKKFIGRDFIFLESNHDIEMLKRSPRPMHIKNRILGDKGHLSNEASSELSLKLAKKGLKRLMLGHLSGEANTPELAYKVTADNFEKNNIKINSDITLDIAERGILSQIITF